VRRSTVDKWGLGLACAAVALWGVGIVAGPVRGLEALLAVSYAVLLLGFLQPSLGLIGAGAVATLDNVPGDWC